MDGLQAENLKAQKLRKDGARDASGSMDCTEKSWTEELMTR